MAELKTKATKENVNEFLNNVENENRRQDSFTLVETMQKISGFEPKMWGSSIVGFGDYHYMYESGREGDFFQIGFSPRKQSMSVYLTCNGEVKQSFLKKLGKHKMGKGCLYINRLSDINIMVLEELIQASLDYMQKEKSK